MESCPGNTRSFYSSNFLFLDRYRRHSSTTAATRGHEWEVSEKNPWFVRVEDSEGL
jgi:hypothetical protein